MRRATVACNSQISANNNRTTGIVINNNTLTIDYSLKVITKLM